ncbi:unnamed protein product [Cylindrotheca closterium]|uniref:Uncharacterized protein n=1 Tax=Cylindrotheca closterium TaxID=2856 RepID=A0AAD2FPB5_9STRA|nr:unnamed protein product [Cylindrotheca closterium]
MGKKSTRYEGRSEKWDPKKLATRLRSYKKANTILKRWDKKSEGQKKFCGISCTPLLELPIPLDAEKLTTKVILKKVCDMSGKKNRKSNNVVPNILLID